MEENISATAESTSFAEFQEKLGKLEKADEKIRQCLDFMRVALSQSKTPRFKDFWEGKRICLPLFKEALSPSTRSHLWSEYVEISTEGRRLKEILDEQSAFAVEQIDLAISALEKDLETYEELLKQIPEFHIPDSCHCLTAKKESYNTIQRELYLLNTLAARVTALRKEVIKTEMRIRTKNKFFERLSKLGDNIFPRRKELIKNISSQFIADIEAFVKNDFEGEKIPVYVLRDEIKSLQAMAKLLSLDTHAFTETRLLLSKCWDLLKQKDQDRKQENVERKEEFQKNFDLVMDKIKPLAEKCQSETFSLDDAMKQTTEILNMMKDLELGREDVRLLKDELFKARKPILDRLREAESAREKVIEDQLRQKREKIELFKKEIDTILAQMDQMPSEEISKEKDRLAKELQLLPVTAAERELLEDSLKLLRDRLIDKKEKAMMALPEAELRSLEQLKKMLQERKSQRDEIKSQLEEYRKALSGSGFDFEKAMRYGELIDAEKARLDKANNAIEEIEEKISELQE